MGMAVVSFGILGLAILYLAFDGNIDYITGFGFGASSIALFARVGGGIYTKAADVGADLVGKVEQGIDWTDIAGLGVLNTYIELDYIADSKRYDWNNAIKLGLGAKLKTRIGKNLLQVGAKFVQDRRWVTDRTDETFLIFVNWSSGWGHNTVSRDVPNK